MREENKDSVETPVLFKKETLSRTPIRSVGGKHSTRSAAERWGGKASLFEAGFLSVPRVFLSKYASLRPHPLTSGEALFVLHLMTFKWERAAPFPAYERIARLMGVKDKMVRRHARSLEQKGYLRREYQHRGPNKFDLTGLFDALAKYVENQNEDGI